MDNQPALLQVGDEIPISTGIATILTNANTPVVSTIEMQNTGVILKVLPHVYANGTIQMEIEQEVSNVVNSESANLDANHFAAARPFHDCRDKWPNRAARRSH